MGLGGMAVINDLCMLRGSTWWQWVEKTMGYEARRQGSRQPAEFSSRGKRLVQGGVYLVVVN